MRYLTALLVLTSSTMLAQSPATDDQSPSAAVLRLEDSWAKALVARDRATFEKLLAPKFIYTEDTTTTDRVMTLASLFGADTVTEAHNQDMKVEVLGNTAIVTGWLVTYGHNKAGPFYRRYRFTDTWMKGTNWRIVAAHDVLVERK